MNIVISQSMYFPWVGMLEQVKLADTYVYYDDVQFSKGSFVNRVQYKTAQGVQWLTVPVKHKIGVNINETQIDNRKNWQHRQRESLRQAYSKCIFLDEMLEVFDAVNSKSFEFIGELSRASLMAVVDYFDLRKNKEFVHSFDLGVKGSGSQRVMDIVRLLKGNIYITGHGATQYLDHELFERNGIEVQYIDYKKIPYEQKHNSFTPFVSSLDLIANCGHEGIQYICSGTKTWKNFHYE